MVHLPGNAGAGKNRMRAGKRSNMIALAPFTCTIYYEDREE